MRVQILVVAFVMTISTVSSQALNLAPQQITVAGNSTTLMVPEGMQVQFMAAVPGARFPALGPDNEMIIGSNGSTVFRLAPPYNNATTLVQIGNRSHSVAYRGNKLFIADTAGLHEAPYNGLSTNLQAGDLVEIADLPVGGHSSRTVIAAPDGTLYLSIGISGNCSNQYIDNSYPFETRRGGVFLIDESGLTPELVPFASGLRNPIGIAVHPATGDLWATNAGSDNLGYEEPREVFARLSQDSWHGMPWFQYINGSFQDGQCINTATAPRPAIEARAPAVTFLARSTPMGIAFVTDNRLGDDFNGNALVSVHGSWATDPTKGGGPETRRPPKVAMVNFSGNQAVSMEDVVTGFQRDDGSRFARPNGAIIGPDGQFYFTSDSGEVQGLFRLVQLVAIGNATITPGLILLLDD
jgi:glucose/arabinose dehydrogenase